MNISAGILGKDFCNQAKFQFPNGKPVFFKTLQNFFIKLPQYRENNTLLIDDNKYKCLFNWVGTHIIVPPLPKRPGGYLTQDLRTWLLNWLSAEDRLGFTTTFKCPEASQADKWVMTRLRDTDIDKVSRPIDL